MEQDKVNWLMSDKLDRLRRAHALKIGNGSLMNPQTTKSKSELNGVPFKYFQTSKCTHKSDRTTKKFTKKSSV